MEITRQKMKRKKAMIKKNKFKKILSKKKNSSVV